MSGMSSVTRVVSKLGERRLGQESDRKKKSVGPICEGYEETKKKG